MKLQRSTLTLVMLACISGTAYGVYQLGVVPHQEKVELQSKKLFDWNEDQVQKLSVQTSSDLLIFERRSETVPTPWQMLKPQEKLASDASVSFLLNLLTTQSSESTLTIARDRLAEFGLVQPPVTIDITLEDQTAHQMLLGNPDFSGNSLYALVDPDPNAAEVEVRVVSNQFQFGTNRDLAEWEYTEPPEPEASPEVPEPDASPDALEPKASPEVAEPDAEENNDPPVTPE
ncbi:MAG: hypothetical protein ACO3EZ_12855 [Prochlorotrichaceae cyanobacterium]